MSDYGDMLQEILFNGSVDVTAQCKYKHRLFDQCAVLDYVS